MPKRTVFLCSLLACSLNRRRKTAPGEKRMLSAAKRKGRWGLDAVE